MKKKTTRWLRSLFYMTLLVSVYLCLIACMDPQEPCAMLNLAPWSPNQVESTPIWKRPLALLWPTSTPGPLSWCWSPPPLPSSLWVLQNMPLLLSILAAALLLWLSRVSQQQPYVSTHLKSTKIHIWKMPFVGNFEHMHTGGYFLKECCHLH